MPNLTPRAGAAGAKARSPQGISPVNRTVAAMTASTPVANGDSGEFRTSTPKDDGHGSKEDIEVASPIAASNGNGNGNNGSNGNGLSKYLAAVTDELWKRGYTDEDLRKIYAGNMMRVWKTAWK